LGSRTSKISKGGLWIGLIKPYEPIPKDAKVCECKLYKRDKIWYLDVVVQRYIPAKTEYQNVIAIDMGFKHIATFVELEEEKKKGRRGRGRKFNRKLSGFP
jgi:transposase